MPHKLNDDISECYRLADECRRRADETTDPSTKQDYLDMARRWLGLARSHTFAEELFMLHESHPPKRSPPPD
jgi:hypothetical protein